VSLCHDGPFARNFWASASTSSTLPVKPTLPWAAFYLRQLTGEFFGAADG